MLQSEAHWFDEIYVWTEGFEASTTQRARIQSTVLEKAFLMLEGEKAERVGVTLSFGTVERFLEQVVDALHAHPLVAHRMVILLRGSMERLRSRYRMRSFVDHLRSLHIPVGYRVTAKRVTMELKALDFLRPDFAKLLAPESMHIEPWQDLVLEARVADVPPESMIVAGLEHPRQVELAQQVGIRFGQGSAVRPAYAPIAT